jgi:hypothetical protein
MREKNMMVTTAFILAFFLGCAHGPRPVKQRGWIGGSYLEASTSFFKSHAENYFEKGGGVIPALPGTVKKGRKGAVFVSDVFENTPAKASDIREGDLILAVDGENVETVGAFRQSIDSKTPGETIRLTVYRGGEISEKHVVVGRETYRNVRSLSLGFRLSAEVNPIPYPGFNILGLLSFEKNTNRLELNSPAYVYYKTVRPFVSNDGTTEEENLANWEGWDVWCLIIGVGGKKIIVDQASLPVRPE